MNNGLNRRIPFMRYFPKSIKFYDLKSEKIAAGVFVILLAINFCASLLISKFTGNVQIDSSQMLSEDVASAFGVFLRLGIISILSSLLMTVFTH